MASADSGHADSSATEAENVTVSRTLKQLALACSLMQAKRARLMRGRTLGTSSTSRSSSSLKRKVLAFRKGASESLESPSARVFLSSVEKRTQIEDGHEEKDSRQNMTGAHAENGSFSSCCNAAKEINALRYGDKE